MVKEALAIKIEFLWVHWLFCTNEEERKIHLPLSVLIFLPMDWEAFSFPTLESLTNWDGKNPLTEKKDALKERYFLYSGKHGFCVPEVQAAAVTLLLLISTCKKVNVFLTQLVLFLQLQSLSLLTQVTRMKLNR